MKSLQISLNFSSKCVFSERLCRLGKVQVGCYIPLPYPQSHILLLFPSLKVWSRLLALPETMKTGRSLGRLPTCQSPPLFWPLPTISWSLTLPVTISQSLNGAKSLCSTWDNTDHQKFSPQLGWRLLTLPETTQI